MKTVRFKHVSIASSDDAKALSKLWMSADEAYTGRELAGPDMESIVKITESALLLLMLEHRNLRGIIEIETCTTTRQTNR